MSRPGILGLDRVLGRSPSALSGGERQRVAIGRALVREPRIVLFDEPFSNLDIPLRAALREEVIELHRRFKTTLIHVTHDQSEALLMGDRVVVLEKGQLRQCDAPRTIYDRPTHRFVATFVGSPPMNLLPCQIERDGEMPAVSPDRHRSTRLRWQRARSTSLPAGGKEPPGSSTWESGRKRSRCGLRPRRHDRAASRRKHRARRCGGSSSTVPELLATLAVGPHRLIARLPASQALEDGQRVEAVLDLSKSVWFDQTTGEAI